MYKKFNTKNVHIYFSLHVSKGLRFMGNRGEVTFKVFQKLKK